MFNVRGTPRSAAYVAKQLHMLFVEDSAKNYFRPKDIHLPESPRFYSKIYLYCEAAVLRVLLSEEQRNKDYKELVIEFEKLVFPRDPTHSGMVKLEAIKDAMNA